MRGRAGVWITWWIVLAALWLLLVSKVNPVYVGTGIVLGALAAAWAALVKSHGLTNAVARLGWLRLLGRLPGTILSDTARVGGALLKSLSGAPPPAGEYRDITFHPGGDDPISAARRALVVLGVSLSPNTFVVAVDRERGLLRIHQLVPSAQPSGEDKEWPL